MLKNEGTVAKKRKYFDVKSGLIEALIEAHNQAQSWPGAGQKTPEIFVYASSNKK